MKTFEYKDRNKHRQDWCQGCGRRVGKKMLAPHHIYLSRYGDQCIWLCIDCHRRIDTDRAWAYDKGLLRHHNVKDPRMKKTTKKKTCKHEATIFDREAGDWVCQFCGKVVGELRMGKP